MNEGEVSNNEVKKVKFGWFDGDVDGQYSNVGLLSISDIFATQVEFYFTKDPFNRVSPPMQGG